MDGSFGINAIQSYKNMREKEGSSNVDLPGTYTIAYGLFLNLQSAGYTCMEYSVDEFSYERSIRSNHLDGYDRYYADAVDLFFISCHGNNDEGVTRLAFNSENERWRTWSSEWKLGDFMLRWLALYSCKTINLDKRNDLPLANIFDGLHLFLGSPGSMYSSITWAGRDFADDLVDGDSICSAWMNLSLVSLGRNSTAVVSAESESTWNGGRPKWSKTTLHLDKYPRVRGGCVKSIRAKSIYWFGYIWIER